MSRSFVDCDIIGPEFRPNARVASIEGCEISYDIEPDEPVSADLIQRRFRERMMVVHPDRGGTDEQMAALNRARDEALAANP